MEAAMDTRSPGCSSKTSAITVSRRSALRAISLAGASAAFFRALGTLSVTAAQPDSPPADWFDPDMTFSGHGQVIIGEGPIYLSHLPMFLYDNRLGPSRGHPHHYQVILEVVFSGAGADDYVNDRRETGAPLYTLAPSPFHMLDLIAPVPEDSRLSSFTGTVFRGHFERQDSPQPFDIEPEVLPNDVKVDVTRVVHAHEFSFHPAPLERLEYILFGEGEELFLAHRITRPPDFDQLLPVRIEDHTFAEEELQRGIIVAVPDRANILAERLMDGDTVSGEARAPGTGVLLASGIQLEAGPEFYFEESELHFPAVDDTQAEIDAGFGFR
jgi:hypothetical protein